LTHDGKIVHSQFGGTPIAVAEPAHAA